MSKKQLNSRLNHLFSDLENSYSGQDHIAAADDLPASLSRYGWSWEADPLGIYTACSSEVEPALGITPDEFIFQSVKSFRLHHASSAQVKRAINGNHLPAELDVFFQDSAGGWKPVRLQIYRGPEGDGAAPLRGFALPLPEGSLSIPSEDTLILYPSVENSVPALVQNTDRQGAPFRETTPQVFSNPLIGVAIDPLGISPAQKPWTETGLNSIQTNQIGITSSGLDTPATMAVPFQVSEMGDLLLEVVDDTVQRNWTDDERFMVQEITTQLALALENARLYQSAQQELSERVRAEQIILHRNQDLATLNRIGQRLSSLASRDEIFQTLTQMVGEVLDNRNLYLCMIDPASQTISFPIYRENGEAIEVNRRSLRNELPDYVAQLQKPLLLTEKIAFFLDENNIHPPVRIPTSFMAIPLVAGENQVGALVIQDFESEKAEQFDEVHLELLSTAVSQSSTALENANLFDQMQTALKAIENRERYQAGVARSAASLSELGAQALADVLKHLANASQANRVYFSRYNDRESGGNWKLVAEWTAPLSAYLFDRTSIQAIPYEKLADEIGTLHSQGWLTPLEDITSSTTTARFFREQNILSALILEVHDNQNVPGILVFEQIDQPRRWLSEEINILRVSADAISNTYVRENLMSQLQVNLDETENLYRATNRLVLASDFQEMLAAVINAVKLPGINRGILLLFESDALNKINKITVQANWYSGYGTPPPPVQTEFSRSAYERHLHLNSPIFVEDITHSTLDDAFRHLMSEQKVQSLAMLPLIAGKRQIGVLLLEGENQRIFSGSETRILPPLIDQLTISVENQRLFAQTQEALAETGLLYSLSNQIAQAQDINQMLNLVVENALPTHADSSAIILINSDASGEMTELEFSGFRDRSGTFQQQGFRLPLTALPLVRVLSDEGIVIPDINDFPIDAVSRQTLAQLMINAVAILPLRTGGRLVGILTASSHQPADFDPQDVNLLRTVANGIAVAVEKQRLLRQAQRRALELQTASEIARDTTSTLSLDLLLSRIVNLLIDRFSFYHASIFLLDETGTFAMVRESTGLAGSELKKRGHKLAVGSRSVVGTVTATGEAFVLNDTANAPMYYPNPLLPETRAEMGLPLKLGNRVIGALDMQSKNVNAFAQDDVNVLGILADQIAIAIENARAYELSQHAIEDMREVDRVKSQFLANMSHELRTPLNSIIGFSRVILKGIDGPVNEMQTQDLSAIYSSGQHLLTLINEILDFSKLEAGKMELSLSEVNIADMINGAMSTAVGLVKDKPIKLTHNIEPNLPAIKVDLTRIRQVLINFLSNAAKFTDEGAITVEARRIRSPKGVPEVIITVSDTGPGIADTDRGKLFLPFSQVDDSPTRKTGGTGLGLSICRSLIEMHGGRIGLLSSVVGQGSIFFFTLPVQEVEEDSPDFNPDENHVVLCIDDDPQVISLYERFLKPQGYKVIPHIDPKTAVMAAKKHRPYAITVDVMMPERDGWQVMSDLKSDPDTRDIPIVVCSILEEEEKGFSLGAADYLVKPFLQEDLSNAINRLNRDGQIKEILVIDDEPGDSRLVQKMLEEQGRFHVQLAEGGTNGWDAIQNHKPDAVILDLFMPDMDGFTLISHLRADPNLRDIPVIVLTGADLTTEQHQKLAEFGQQLLSKGYLRENELLNTLEESLRKLRTAPKAAVLAK
jgi:signal transduction histidine kinase/CheY-like chemotaxis protein